MMLFATFVLTDREMSGVVRSFQSSFYGKEIGNKLFVSKDVDTQRRSRATITSLVLILWIFFKYLFN